MHFKSLFNSIVSAKTASQIKHWQKSTGFQPANKISIHNIFDAYYIYIKLFVDFYITTSFSLLKKSCIFAAITGFITKGTSHS